jgi:RNA 2',3'-cyclic 3'-phosphodiesterase
VNPTETARLFLAGTLPEDLIRGLEKQLASVRTVCRQVRWTKAETLHLTLVFLGLVEGARVEGLTSALAAVARRHAPLALEVTGMDTFGPARSPRVLAASLGGEVDRLGALVDDGRAAVEPSVALEPPRPFRPHLTVARSRGQGGDPLLARCRTALATSLSGAFRLERIVLFRSETLPGGAVHTPLASWTLGA